MQATAIFLNKSDFTGQKSGTPCNDKGVEVQDLAAELPELQLVGLKQKLRLLCFHKPARDGGGGAFNEDARRVRPCALPDCRCLG
eukprot:2845858-Amphidinium_carterae.1